VLCTAGSIGGIKVEALFQRPRGDPQRPIAQSGFQRFEIEVLNGFRAQKTLDLFDQTDLQGRDERGFFLRRGGRRRAARAVAHRILFR